MEISIRPYLIEDAAQVFEAVRGSIEDICPWMPWCHADYSIDDSETYLAISVAGFEKGEIYDFAVLRDGHFVGACGLNQVNIVEGVANMGYWLRTSESGKGIMAQAAKKVLEWAFENTNLNRIEIVAAIENKRSQRVAEKIGAHQDAVLAKRVIIDSKPSSAVLYSVIRP